MDDKTLTAVASSLALMLLLERHTPMYRSRKSFSSLLAKGVQTVGLEISEVIPLTQSTARA
jgi:hypothetical protein